MYSRLMGAELNVQHQQTGKEAGLHPIPIGESPTKKALICSGTEKNLEEGCGPTYLPIKEPLG